MISTITMMKTKKGLYTILYPFMASILGLAGLAKECFAVIFGFWFSQGQQPIGVSLTTMQIITGGTRPAVILAIHKLEEAGLILAMRTPGKKTIYDVKMPDQALADFKAMYPSSKLVNSFTRQEYASKTSPSKTRIPENKKNANHDLVITPLRVKPASEIHTGGLQEA